MKNTLWFLYKPQDERERELYYRACTQAFTFLMIALVISMGLVTNIFIAAVILFLIITAYLVGWTTLRNEEVTHPITISSHLPPAKVVWGVLGGIVLVSMGVLLLARVTGILNLQLATYSTFAFSILWLVIVRVFAWQSTDQVQLPARLTLVFFFPLFTIIFARVKGKSTGEKMVKALGILFVLFIPLLIVTFIFIVRTLSLHPLS